MCGAGSLRVTRPDPAGVVGNVAEQLINGADGFPEYR